jgi:hypothetical protein
MAKSVLVPETFTRTINILGKKRTNLEQVTREFITPRASGSISELVYDIDNEFQENNIFPTSVGPLLREIDSKVKLLDNDQGYYIPFKLIKCNYVYDFGGVIGILEFYKHQFSLTGTIEPNFYWYPRQVSLDLKTQLTKKKLDEVSNIVVPKITRLRDNYFK